MLALRKYYVLYVPTAPVWHSREQPKRSFKKRSPLANPDSFQGDDALLAVPGEGIEPPTNGLQNRCSTAELTRLPARELSASPHAHKEQRVVCRWMTSPVG